MSGARSQSAVYLPSCLAISSAKFRPPRLAGRGSPIFIRLGRNESAPIQGFASGKTLVRAMRRGPPEAGAGERAGMEKRRTLSVRRSKPICGLLAQLLGDLPGEVPPRFSFDWGEMNPPQSKVLPPAKRLYAPCGAARRRRAQENAQAWKSAGHSVSGARRQSVVYLPSCLAISSAKFSCFFSMPSPFSKRTAFLKVMVPPRVLATEAIYCSTVMALSFTNSCCSRQFSL